MSRACCLLPHASWSLARARLAKLGQLRSLGRRGFNRSLERSVGLSVSVMTGGQQQQLTTLPVKLGITPALIVLFRDGYGFINEPKRVQSSSCVAIEHGPQSKMVRNPKGGVGPPELLERRLVGGQTFIELPDSAIAHARTTLLQAP